MLSLSPCMHVKDVWENEFVTDVTETPKATVALLFSVLLHCSCLGEHL